MIITRMDVQGVRNLLDVHINPSRGVNLITGANASGKTSLLEAIHILGQGRSFRSTRIGTIIHHQNDCLRVTGELGKRNEPALHRIGIQRCLHKTRIRLDQQDVQQISRIARLLPIQLLTPESIRLLEQGPSQRRKYLDWGLFHVEQSFMGAWQAFSRALRQRNAALRNGEKSRQIRVWDQSLIENGEQITRLRKTYVEKLRQPVNQVCLELLGFSPELVYRQGWRQEISYQAALDAAVERDRLRGMTTVGPHRADLGCLVDGNPVQEVFSRGQLKMLVAALRIAQTSLLAPSQDKRPVFLIDDLAAELDSAHRRILLELLANTAGQTFVTATDPELIDLSPWKERRMFHVEHGKITEVV